MSSTPIRLTEKMASLDSPFHVVIAVCVVAALSYLAAELGGALVLRPQMIWPLWPGCAFLVAVLLLTPRKIWPALLVAGLTGFVFYDVRAGLPIRAVSWLILGDTLEIIIASLGITYLFGGVPCLRSIKSLAKYSLFAVVLAPIAAASIGAFAFGGDYWVAWRISFLTEALALLTLTPAILSWVDTIAWAQNSRAYYLEAATLFTGLVILGYFTCIASGGNRPELLYSLVPFLLWSALRFGITGTTTSALVVAFLSIWGAVHGRGPFIDRGPLDDALSLQMFLCCTAAPFIVLAVLVEERKATDVTLRENRAQLAGIISTAMEAIITIDAEQRIHSFNRAAEKMFACSAKDALGQSIDRFIPEQFRAQHGEYIQSFGTSGVSSRATGTLGELWALRVSGERFPIEASVSATQVGGKKLFTVILRDITERKRAESAVRESEQRFRLVANTAPVLIWMAGPDTLCNYFNQPWLDFTGRRLDAELGNGWTERVHPEDLDRCLDTYIQAFDRREQFKMEYRLRRFDGEYRWLLDIGVPRFNADHSFAGYIGSCIDISERKLAEEVLSSVNRRLIEAQERERTRIARELHDDIGQRLALLAVALQQMRQTLPDSAAEVGGGIDELLKETSEMSNDIQALSHELHSSKLEYLGVVAAMRSFCNEFSKQQGVEVAFKSYGLSGPLPSPEISLSLYRVLQESLHNAAKHSGVRHFEVQLSGRPGEIHLTVSDSGAGFDILATRAGGGLGLTSMRERLKLIKGELSIESQPKRGTTIHARVPLDANSNSERAVG
jgi:PAS domain S-box-containing protein